VHILDASDVIYVVNQDSPADWLAVYIANEVALIPAGVDSIIWVEHFYGEDGWILASHCDGPGIWFGDIVHVLLRVV